MDTVPFIRVGLAHEGELEVALLKPPDGIPPGLQEVLERPLNQFVFFHRPKHWRMDLMPVTDRHAVFVCRECKLRVPVATRPDVQMDLFLFLVYLMTTKTPHDLQFDLPSLFFNHYFNERRRRHP